MILIVIKTTSHDRRNYLLNKIIILVIKIVWPAANNAIDRHMQIYCSHHRRNFFINKMMLLVIIKKKFDWRPDMPVTGTCKFTAHSLGRNFLLNKMMLLVIKK
jgi:hypothetical protein